MKKKSPSGVIFFFQKMIFSFEYIIKKKLNMNHQLIYEAFSSYSRRMNRLYQELYSIKESFSHRQSNLLMEGFLDTIKAGARGFGSFLGKTTKAISDFSTDVYNKGVELGKKAIEIGKDLVNKISTAVSNAIDYIKKTPGRIWEGCKEIYSSVTNEIAEIWKKAKEKGSEFLKAAQDTIKTVYQKVASRISEAVKSFTEWASANKEAFLKWLDTKKNELYEAAKTAMNSASDMAKKVGNQVMKFFQKTGKMLKGAGYAAAGYAKVAAESGIKFAKMVALFAIGCVALPFIAAGYVIKKTYELGKEVIQWTSDGLVSIKNNCAEIWNEFSNAFQAAASGEPQAQLEGFLHKTFKGYVRHNF